jgi:hypothetical protein
MNELNLPVPQNNEAVKIWIKSATADTITFDLHLRTQTRWLLFKDLVAYVGGVVVISDNQGKSVRT